jgi:alpha,alpha-trehalase
MSQKLLNFIQNGWGKARTVAGEKDLDLPHPFVPPSISADGFRNLYYWDTYFTNVGLIADGHIDWAKDNVEDLLYALHHFGCVPNYTRKDGADFCSQPPLLSLMVKDVYKQTKDEAWLAKAVDGLEKEYVFWMTKRMTKIGLNQYGCNATDEQILLGYYDYVSGRMELDQNLSNEEKTRIAKNFVAEAESGEDYTPRYAHHNALDYVQIDLNAHLYGMEDFLCNYFKDKNEEKFIYYKTQKDRRIALIERYCFNEKTGVYCDYDFVSEIKNDIVCAACFLPYFYGFARKESNLASVYNVLKTKGGIVACQDTGDTAYQWGYPYIWAPYQYFAYVALVSYGLDEQANELRTNYMHLLASVFDQTNVLWERYDENGVAADLEYPTQQMLGWTAGVYRYLYSQSK